MDTTTPSPPVRIGDAERQRAATHLGEAFTQGYLSMAEYESRLGHAFAADTAAALTAVTADLPVARISRQSPRRRAARVAAARRGVRIHLFSYLAMSVLMIGIWLAVGVGVGAWYFWPVWPILGGGIGILSHAIPVREWARRPPHYPLRIGHNDFQRTSTTGS